MNKIINLLDKHFSDIKNFENVVSTINSTLSKIKVENISKKLDGYCMRFTTPDREIEKLFSAVPGLTVDDIESEFRALWAYPKNSPMYSSSYYQNLILLHYYCVIKDGKIKTSFDLKEVMKNSIYLIMIKMWNGRVSNSFPKYCNPEIMRYVVSNLLSGKSYAKKYESPDELIYNIYVPNFAFKYNSDLKKSPKKTKDIFMRCYNSLRQLFRFDGIKNLETNKTIYNSGLQPLYYKSLDASSVEKINQDQQDESSSDNVLDSLYNSNDIADYIVNRKPSPYPDEFLSFLFNAKKITMKKSTINNIMISFSNYQLNSEIVVLLNTMRNFVKISDWNIVCSRSFFDDVIQKNIISSKNNTEINDLKKALNEMLYKMLALPENDYLKKIYENISDFTKFQIKKILIFGIAYNIQKYLCSKKYEGQ